MYWLKNTAFLVSYLIWRINMFIESLENRKNFKLAFYGILLQCFFINIFIVVIILYT